MNELFRSFLVDGEDLLTVSSQGNHSSGSQSSGVPSSQTPPSNFHLRVSSAGGGGGGGGAGAGAGGLGSGSSSGGGGRFGIGVGFGGLFDGTGGGGGATAAAGLRRRANTSPDCDDIIPSSTQVRGGGGGALGVGLGWGCRLLVFGLVPFCGTSEAHGPSHTHSAVRSFSERTNTNAVSLPGLAVLFCRGALAYIHARPDPAPT